MPASPSMFVVSLALGVGAQAFSTAAADDALGYRLYSKAAPFEDVRDDVKNAIIGRGFVIDYVGHFNAMLERTADAAASVTPKGEKSPYRNAEYIQFCPAALTHEAVSKNPIAIANCPIAIFVYQASEGPERITVGFRLPVASPSTRAKAVNDKLVALLDGIAQEATK